MSLAVGAEPAYYDYMRGMVEERAGNLNQALSAYERAVAQDPNALEIYRDIAQINLRLGKTDAALQAAEKIRELAPTDPASFIFLGNIYVAQGNLAKAAETYEKALTIDPRSLRALENLGNYYAVIDPDKGVTYYQRYLDIEPNDPEMVFQLGMIQHKAGQTEKAIETFRKAVRMDPNQVAPHLALAEIYEARKSTAAAVEEFEQAARLQPDQSLIQFRLAQLYYSQKRIEEAGRNFTAVAEAQPKNPIVHYWLARVSEDQEKWAEAAQHAQKAYDNSQDAQFLPLLAYYLTMDRRPNDALSWLEKARKTPNPNANVFLFLGINYLEIGKAEKALEALNQGLSSAPQDPQMRFQVGVALDRLNRFPEAVEHFQSAIKLDPQNAAAMNYLGYTWAERGEHLQEAESLLRQALKIDPNNGAFIDSLGWALHKQGKSREAVTWLEKAAAQADDALIVDHLGDAYAAAGLPVKAMQTWEKVRQLDPGNTEVETKLKNLQGAGAPVPEARTQLRTVTGNFRRIADLRSRVVITGKAQKQPVKIEGLLFYRRPSDLLVQMAGGPNSPDVRILVEQSGIRLEPPDYSAVLPVASLEELRAISFLFSGDAAAAFDQPELSSERDDNLWRYRSRHADLWIETAQPRLKRLIRRSPSGGRDEIEVESYRDVDGIPVPERLRFRNRSRGIDARVVFSDWVVNNADNAKAFAVPSARP